MYCKLISNRYGGRFANNAQTPFRRHLVHRKHAYG
uniref:Uncharacterized protein n=1 Tax=Neisseria meningitidis alpha153 TaxID=663926 RepID=C6SD32_NEIME|nr:hypothetical protein predicted by Glimmer/Critica [Neisseria meningitidis alpha153]